MQLVLPHVGRSWVMPATPLPAKRFTEFGEGANNKSRSNLFSLQDQERQAVHDVSSRLADMLQSMGFLITCLQSTTSKTSTM